MNIHKTMVDTVIDKVSAAAAQVIKARTEEMAQIYHAAEHKEHLTDGYWQERYKAEMRLHAAVALWDAFLDVQKMPPIILGGIPPVTPSAQTTSVVEHKKIVVERSRKMYREVNYARGDDSRSEPGVTGGLPPRII